MPRTTFTHLYDTYEEAAQAVQQLEAHGIPHADISIVSNDPTTRPTDTTYAGDLPYDNSIAAGPSVVPGAVPGVVPGIAPVVPPMTARTGDYATNDDLREYAGDDVEDERETGTAAGTGATLGTVIGGGAGLLAGLGALAIPGVGPVVAAGWLIASLTGAGAGAGVGGLLGSLIGHGVHHDDAHVYSEGVRRGGTVVAVQAEEADAARISQLLETLDPVDVQSRRADYASTGWSGYDPAAPGYTSTEVEAERARVRGGNI